MNLVTCVTRKDAERGVHPLVEARGHNQAPVKQHVLRRWWHTRAGSFADCEHAQMENEKALVGRHLHGRSWICITHNTKNRISISGTLLVEGLGVIVGRLIRSCERTAIFFVNIYFCQSYLFWKVLKHFFLWLIIEIQLFISHAYQVFN